MSNSDPRDEILAAAGPIFADKGFKGATVREICAAAGVNLAAINYYFGDKRRLYIESVNRAHESRSQQVPMPVWPDGTAPETKLRDYVRTMVTRMVVLTEGPWQTRLVTREVLHPTEACRELSTNYFQPLFRLLLSIIKEVVRDPLPEERLHKIGWSIIGQCVFYRVAGDVVKMMTSESEIKAEFTVEDLARHIADFSLSALGPNSINNIDATIPDSQGLAGVKSK